MKKFQKVMVLFLAITLICSGLMGCGGEQTETPIVNEGVSENVSDVIETIGDVSGIIEDIYEATTGPFENITDSKEETNNNPVEIKYTTIDENFFNKEQIYCEINERHDMFFIDKVILSVEDVYTALMHSSYRDDFGFEPGEKILSAKFGVSYGIDEYLEDNNITYEFKIKDLRYDGVNTDVGRLTKYTYCTTDFTVGNRLEDDDRTIQQYIRMRVPHSVQTVEVVYNLKLKGPGSSGNFVDTTREFSLVFNVGDSTQIKHYTEDSSDVINNNLYLDASFHNIGRYASLGTADSVVVDYTLEDVLDIQWTVTSHGLTKSSFEEMAENSDAHYTWKKMLKDANDRDNAVGDLIADAMKEIEGIYGSEVSELTLKDFASMIKDELEDEITVFRLDYTVTLDMIDYLHTGIKNKDINLECKYGGDNMSYSARGSNLYAEGPGLPLSMCPQSVQYPVLLKYNSDTPEDSVLSDVNSLYLIVKNDQLITDEYIRIQLPLRFYDAKGKKVGKISTICFKLPLIENGEILK